jgi:NADPH-dependent 2,4-dienoyl-CoA reductase/sulfur reductase-like enzyme
MAHNIVVVGGGPAAVFAAIEAKKHARGASVTLVTAENCEPYEKPPLSKAVLLDKAKPEDAPIAGLGGLVAHGVAVKLNAQCTGIERITREVITTAGRLPYDALVLATGSIIREIPALPRGMPRVHYLRTDADARTLHQAFKNCTDLVVIGAGLIGLEVAASAAELGLKTTVIEAAPGVMMRACDEETSAQVIAEHLRRGVTIQLGVAVTAVTWQSDGRLMLSTSDDISYVADHVVVGAGVAPNDALGAAAGLLIEDGIVVNDQCCTSDPAIFAAGDCTRFPGPSGLVRLENWRHALDQGAIAGRNAAGAGDTYHPVPSFWSEQYDLYIQGVGWPDPDARLVRRPLPGKSALLLQVADGVIRYAIGINVTRDFAAVRRLIERKVTIDPGALMDPTQPFAAMLKVKA